jgi:hypothetical protein
MMEIPLFSEELIKLLDEMFPHRCPDLGQSLEEIHRYAGKREIVDMLVFSLKNQQSRQVKETLNVPISRTP